MLQTFLEDGSTSPEEVDWIIWEQLGEKVATALSEYNGHMSNLLVKVVSRSPGLLERKLIVFPFCEGDLHWSATFVFNADSIFESVEQVTRLQTKAGLCDIASFGIARYEMTVHARLN